MDALDDSGSAKHAGYEEKEARRKRRQMRLAKAGKKGGLAARGRVAADPECVLPVFPQSPSIYTSFLQSRVGCHSSQRFSEARAMGEAQGDKSPLAFIRVTA